MKKSGNDLKDALVCPLTAASSALQRMVGVEKSRPWLPDGRIPLFWSQLSLFAVFYLESTDLDNIVRSNSVELWHRGIVAVLDVDPSPGAVGVEDESGRFGMLLLY